MRGEKRGRRLPCAFEAARDYARRWPSAWLRRARAWSARSHMPNEAAVSTHSSSTLAASACPSDGAPSADPYQNRVRAMSGGAAREGLPSGIVTFVFTDIEQSTRLLRHLGP